MKKMSISEYQYNVIHRALYTVHLHEFTLIIRYMYVHDVHVYVTIGIYMYMYMMYIALVRYMSTCT